MRFTGKIAYVTGASSGIGKGAAIRLGQEGAKVILLGRRKALLDEVAAQCNAESVGVALDVTDRDAVAGVLASTVAEHGGPDIVVHNAGETVLGALHDLTEDEWDRQFNTNLKSIYYTNKVLWPAMVARGGGSIVTIASTASFVGFPDDAAYVATKGAVLSMTKAMALDGAPVGIRVNAVCPGFIWTPNLEGYFNGQPDREAAIAAATTFAPIGRMGTIEDTAGAIAFFASDDASFITGASLLVDGGLLAKA